ncbi:putative Flavin reductase [Frankia alni ACN14a]|uniref:Flavin reductase n=1 Tax=Frankia alni (strain DSM 45986 / CECT 9034 / ACN14a) TaxID=326424 RepID=Q0RKG9_FRAAA|nr:putative Flavin reductase [Frankia alni ACN14a]
MRQALDAGHEIVAVTRRPTEFPLAGARLSVVGADVADESATARAVDGVDAVLSSIGVPFARAPITVYSTAATTLTAAMARLGVKRLAVVSSTAVEPHPHAEGGFLLNRVMQPLIARTIGRSTYADMRAMEQIVRDSGLEWTVIRSSGLFDADHVSPYEVSDGPLDGVFTSRADLAHCLLSQASEDRFVGQTIEITTSEGAPTLLQVIRREAFGRS